MELQEESGLDLTGVEQHSFILLIELIEHCNNDYVCLSIGCLFLYED